MQQQFAQLFPLAFFGLSFAIIFTLISYWEWQSKKSRKKNPLTSDLLRSPGEALRVKIEDLRFDLIGHMLMILFLPIFLFAMSLSQVVFGKKPSLFITGFYIVMGLGCIGYLLRKMIKTKKLQRQYQLGLDAELAVGQELNHLMREGYWVYHDFPADDFNIDHVVIGPTGVFAVETKGRPKPMNDDGSAEREVIYDGESLTFPTWRERKPIQQAELQAKWLEKWLTSAVGEPVAVSPVLAIPGWFIKREKAGGVPIINGKNPSGFFMKFGNSTLTDKLQQQIAHNIDQRCRTVLPLAYSK